MAWAWTAVGWLAVVAGAALFVWALWWDRSRGRRRCPRCWYDMSGVAGLTCSECGCDARRERRLHRTRRRWGWAGIAVVVVLAGGAATRYPAAVSGGWTAAVPAAAWRAVLPLIDPPPDEPTWAWAEDLLRSRASLSTRWARLRFAHRCLVLLRHMERTPDQRLSRSDVLNHLTRARRDGVLAAPTVRRVLDSPDATVDERASALIALAVIDPSEDTFVRLRRAVEHESHLHVRVAAIGMLASRYGNRAETVDLLSRVAAGPLEQASDWHMRDVAMSKLFFVAEHGGPEQRTRAARSLRQIASNHPDALRRAEAAGLLNLLGRNAEAE